jgi:hypothetical protein
MCYVTIASPCFPVTVHISGWSGLAGKVVSLSSPLGTFVLTLTFFFSLFLDEYHFLNSIHLAPYSLLSVSFAISFQDVDRISLLA